MPMIPAPRGDEPGAHRCPTCEGEGGVPIGPPEADAGFDTCPCCDGHGYLRPDPGPEPDTDRIPLDGERDAR